MTKMTEEKLVEMTQEEREAFLGRVEVLDKVKELFLLPNTELMTTKMVAEYFEVNQEAVKKTTQRNREEIASNGMTFKKYNEIKDLFKGDSVSLLEIPSIQLVEMGVARTGVNIFTKRAVLNIAMLLRDSEIAKRVRTALLDQQDELTDSQKVKAIEDEDSLILGIIKSSSLEDEMVAIKKYREYHNRHKEELNARIDEMKPKEAAFDTFIDARGFQRMNDVAKSIGYGRNKLFAFLRGQNVLMADNVPYQSYIERDWFVVKQNTIVRENISQNYVQTFATPKGVNGISKLLKKHGELS